MVAHYGGVNLILPKCATCKKEIDIDIKRNRHQYIFCTLICAKEFASEKPCSRCKTHRAPAAFRPKKKRNYYFLSEVCEICSVRKIRKVVINFTNLRETIQHEDVDSVESRDGLLRIYSKKDRKEYLYPLVNLIKVEVLQ